jgi:hypothetical protein
MRCSIRATMLKVNVVAKTMDRRVKPGDDD